MSSPSVPRFPEESALLGEGARNLPAFDSRRRCINKLHEQKDKDRGVPNVSEQTTVLTK